MIRAGVIWNQRSHRNKGAGRAPLPEDVLDIVPEQESELFAGLRRLAAEGVELVVIDGGDGTVREVLTRLPEAYGGRYPMLAIVPNGKTNALALDLGVPLGASLEDILAAARAGKRPKKRHCLEVLRPGQALPERRGFLFGLGAFVRATELAQRNHDRGLFDNAAVGITLLGAVRRTLFGGSDEPWRRGESVALSFAGERRDWFLVLASTYKRFPLGLKPFGEPHEGLKVLSVEAPPRRLVRAVPAILQGRSPPWLARDGYRRDDVEAFDLDFPGGFVLDGEVFEGGELSLRQGPELEFVIP
ncbi:MAG TPA: diacylglycerol kinase family protein [Phenylobacterium sp.]